MPAIEPRRGAEAFARHGSEVFDRRVRLALRVEDDGKFVAVAVGTKDYEINDDYVAVSRLLGQRPSAEVWLGRAGLAEACHIRQDR